MKKVFLVCVATMALSLTANAQKNETPEQVAEKYTKAVLAFDGEKVQGYSEPKHLPDIYEWMGDWLGANMNILSEDWLKQKLTVKQSSDVVKDSAICSVYGAGRPVNRCIVDVYMQEKDSTGKFHDELIWKLKLIQINNGDKWYVYENFAGSMSATNDAPEQIALNFMNALIDLELDQAEKLGAKRLIYSCEWNGINDYFLSTINQTSYERDYDLDKLRKYKEEGLTLKIFKIEQPEGAECGRELLVWMGHYDAKDEGYDSGRVYLIKDDGDWKVVGYNF